MYYQTYIFIKRASEYWMRQLGNTFYLYVLIKHNINILQDICFQYKNIPTLLYWFCEDIELQLQQMLKHLWIFDYRYLIKICVSLLLFIFPVYGCECHCTICYFGTQSSKFVYLFFHHMCVVLYFMLFCNLLYNLLRLLKLKLG